MVTLDHAIDTVSELSLEQQELLLEIVRKRHIAKRRKEIATDAAASIAKFREGSLPSLSVEAVIHQLHTSLNENDHG